MGVTTERETWVGRSLSGSRTTRCSAARGGSWTTSSPSRTRGTRRSSARSWPTRASRSMRRRRSPPTASGRPHGRGREAPVEAVPRGNRVAGAALRGRRGHGTVCRRAARRRRRTRPVRRGGRGRARRRRLRAARARRRPGRCVGDPRPPLPLRRRRRGARRGAPGGAYDVPCAALHVHAARVLRRRLRLGRGRRTAHGLGELPGAVHAPWRRCRGAGPAWRPASARHAAGFRWVVRRQGRGPAVRGAHRPRVARARRARAVDGGPARASRGELCLDGTAHRLEAGFTAGRRARRAPLRRGRGRRRVRARARARHALPHARLAVRRLPRAERRRPEPRRAHEHDPVRPEPRLRRPAALLRARADDGDRRAPARARPRRARAAEPRAAADMPYRTPSGALYDSGDYAACLDRRSSSRGTTTCVPGRRPQRGGTARRRRPRLRRRAVDLEHGVHHARADGRRARRDAAEVGERRGSLDRDRPARRDHRPARDDAAGPGSPHRLRPGRRRRARLAPEDVTVLSELDTATTPWTVASGNYSSRFSGVGVGAVQAPRGSCARRSTRSAHTSETPTHPCDASPGRLTGAPRAFPTAWSRVS